MLLVEFGISAPLPVDPIEEVGTRTWYDGIHLFDLDRAE